MSEGRYRPALRQGLWLLVPLAVFLMAACMALFWLAFQEQYGTYFILFLIVALLLLIPLGFVLYRAYALLRSSYNLDRNGLHLNWGLRREAIPLTKVEWVRPVSSLTFALPLPRFTFPGAVLGVVECKELGTLEYMASGINDLVLVATSGRVFAVSPSDSRGFLKQFHSLLELGSLNPIEPVSSMPAGFLQRVWRDARARWLVIADVLLTLAFLAFVSLVIPTRQVISLGFDPSGSPLPSVSATRLLLLPLLCIFVVLLDLGVGLFFYRREEQQKAAFLLWIAAAILPLLLTISVLFLI
jgi:hypothetical protein